MLASGASPIDWSSMRKRLGPLTSCADMGTSTRFLPAGSNSGLKTSGKTI
jgi:hypothetical protein